MSATQRSGRNQRLGTGIPGYFAMPTGVVLTNPSARRRAASRSSATDGSPSARDRHSTARRQTRCLSCVEVEDREAARRRDHAAPAPPPCRRRRRRSRTTASSPRRLSPRRKLSAKPQQSVLWPTCPDRSKHDRVDRADRRGLGREPSRCGTMRCLNGCVTLSPAKPSLAQPGHQSRKLAHRRKAERVEVEEPVGVAEPEPRAFGLVHLRRPRFLDAATDRGRREECERLRTAEHARPVRCPLASAGRRVRPLSRGNVGSPATLLSPEAVAALQERSTDRRLWTNQLV